MTFPDPLVIEVTADDIATATPRRGDSCAIAKAVQRTLGLDDGSVSVETDGLVIVSTPTADSVDYKDGPEVTAFIDAFDSFDEAHRAKAQPTTFTLWQHDDLDEAEGDGEYL